MKVPSVSDSSVAPVYIFLSSPIDISWSWVGHSVSASSRFLIYWLTGSSLKCTPSLLGPAQQIPYWELAG